MDKIQVKKLLTILITALVWDINFRFSFKNMDAHMDIGSYPSVKFDPIVILIKNIICAILFFTLYFIFKKINSTKQGTNQLLVTAEKGKINYEIKEESYFLLGELVKYHNLNSNIKIILFCLKIFLLTLIVYAFEEIYFIYGNLHILDRFTVPIRNLCVLISIFILSSLLVKKKCQFYKHQLFSSLIIIGSSLFIILFIIFTVERFIKLLSLSNLLYPSIFILMGIEIVLVKYLTDILYIERLVVLGLKGVVGTILFIVINSIYSKEEFFSFFDKLMSFEYDNMYEDFSVVEKILYIITYIILIYLKIYIINAYSETHFLSVAMISDVFFFPLYIIEKFWIQKFPVTTSSTFYLSIVFGVLNAVLLLIFNEIIELKCCGFEKDLNKNIEKRKQLEMKLTNSISKDDNSESSDSDFINGNLEEYE